MKKNTISASYPTYSNSPAYIKLKGTIIPLNLMSSSAADAISSLCGKKLL